LKIFKVKRRKIKCVKIVVVKCLKSQYNMNANVKMKIVAAALLSLMKSQNQYHTAVANP
jgi:hypothetical protein